MKKTLLITLTFFSSFVVSAQNYQCLQNGVKHYFTNSSGYLRGIRIDSVRTSGTDILYYPFHTPRGRYSYLPGTPVLLDSTGGSWLGKKVIQQNDGTFLFGNMWGDTVVIKTQAHTGDSWIFYNDTTQRYYVANLSVTDTMTVLGVLDSIKKINLSAYDDTGFAAHDSINSFQIILSKNNGFVKAIDLYTFPYHAPDSVYYKGLDFYLDVLTSYDAISWGPPPSATSSQFTLTHYIAPVWSQIFDRSPGDVFEYNVSFPSFFLYYYTRTIVCLDSVINKISYPDSDDYHYSGWIDTGYTYATNHSQTFHNTPVIDTTLMPEEYNPTVVPPHYDQSVLQYYVPNDTTYCAVGTLYKFIQNEIIGSTWEDLLFENSGVQRTYKTGLGMVHYYDYDAGNDFSWDTTLTYYVKSGASCGHYTPPHHPSVVNNIYLTQNAYTIYPNPASTELNISAPGKITSVTINSILGEAVYTGIYNSEQVQVNIAGLPTGIYFVKVNGTEVRKFIKE